MASERTRLTELGTAVGLCFDPAVPWPQSVEQLTIPGLDDEAWKPHVLPATATNNAAARLLRTAIANGCEFRRRVLGGRLPRSVRWTGGEQTTWMSDVPRDITVDDVYFIQAKYNSTCVLSTSPAALADHLLMEDGSGTRTSWFETVAPGALQDYYAVVRGHCPADDLPANVRDLQRPHRQALKTWMAAAPLVEAERAAYRQLCRDVSLETEWRWQRRLSTASPAQRTQMLFRMLRIAGGPYWLLGTKGVQPVRLAVTDTRTWRDRFTLKRFTVAAAKAGQPQVDWRATVEDRRGGGLRAIDGYCELRWSHGKLQGNPECKVQVTTPLEQLPGYEPMG